MELFLSYASSLQHLRLNLWRKWDPTSGWVWFLISKCAQALYVAFLKLCNFIFNTFTYWARGYVYACHGMAVEVRVIFSLHCGDPEIKLGKDAAPHWIILLATADFIYWSLFYSTLILSSWTLRGMSVFCTGIMLAVAVLVLREWCLHLSLCWSPLVFVCSCFLSL